MFKLVQEMMFVNTCVKFRHNRLRNELCRAVMPFQYKRTYVHTGRSLYTHEGIKMNFTWVGIRIYIKKGYVHEIVNYSLYFVDSESDTSTQNVKRCWHDAKYDHRDDNFEYRYSIIWLFVFLLKDFPVIKFRTFLPSAVALWATLQQLNKTL